jgi:hypothetical protein
MLTNQSKSVKIIPMPKRTDIKKIAIIGAGRNVSGTVLLVKPASSITPGRKPATENRAATFRLRSAFAI